MKEKAQISLKAILSLRYIWLKSNSTLAVCTEACYTYILQIWESDFASPRYPQGEAKY